MKMQILNQFFAKRFTILLLSVCQVFINLQDHLHFFLHFVFSFMAQLFMDDPIFDILASCTRTILENFCSLEMKNVKQTVHYRLCNTTINRYDKIYI